LFRGTGRGFGKAPLQKHKRCAQLHFMKVLTLLTLVIFISCGTNKKDEFIESTLHTLDSNPNIDKYSGDTLTFKLSKDQLDKLDFEKVDSLFYKSYLDQDKRFKGFESDFSKVAGPICKQYYFGLIENKDSEYKQVLILQVYEFIDTDNDLFLLTFNSKDSLVSILPIASMIFQSEIEPVFSSVMYPDKRIVKYEVTKNRIPENVDSLKADGNRFEFCTDSLTKEFKFSLGQYRLTSKDSARVCVWRTEW